MNKDPEKFSFVKLYCRIFGHKLKVTKNVTDHVCEYRCKHCGEELTDTANGFLAPLTRKFKETNAYIAKIHRRRKNRKSKQFAKAS
ncbi:DUF1660 family phage protein [Zunongwangia sp.]|uniref:DUF1660 family phage protein n=1 Tax=Zunongwangia sp. TaxID=1965325 RepID=UPI003AA9A764